MIDYNGWRKVEDVDDYIARSGKIQLCVVPPLKFDCEPTMVDDIAIVLAQMGHILLSA